MRHLLILTTIVLLAPCAVAGSFVPIYTDDGLANVPVPFNLTPAAGRSSLVGLFCTVPPTADEIAGVLTYRSSLMSASQAGSLGFPIFSIEGSRSQMVLVRDYSRSVECLANDGQTTLVYGQAIRTILMISDWNASANLNLAAVAADATLGNKTHKILVQVLGFTGPGIDEAVSGLAGKDFDVTTYAEFLSLESKLIEAAGKDPNPRVEKLGAVTEISDSEIETSIAVSHAVSQVSKGRSCSAAILEAPNLSPSRKKAIEDTYVVLTGACDNGRPSRERREYARGLLRGIKSS